jgi:hypothetical protein
MVGLLQVGGDAGGRACTLHPYIHTLINHIHPLSHIHTYIHTYTNTYIHTHKHTHTHTHTYTHTHTIYRWGAMPEDEHAPYTLRADKLRMLPCASLSR